MAGHNDEHFIPEEIDEQIDDYLTPQHENAAPHNDTPEAGIVRALSRHYAPERDLSQPLDRVWKRFEQHQAARQRAGVNRGGSQQAPASYQRGRNRMKQALEHPLREHTFSRRLALIAAIVFVALLVGSMAAVFQLASRQHTVVSGQPQETMMFAQVNGTLYRLDMKTHQPLWHFPAGLGQRVNDTYYTLGEVGEPASAQMKLYALDVESGKIRWQTDLTPGVVINPLISGTTVYVSLQKDGYQTVEALDTANGAKKWEQRIGDKIPGSGNRQLINAPSVTLFAASDKAVYGELTATRLGFITKNAKSSALRFALDAQHGNFLWQENEELAKISAIDRGFVVDGVLCVAKESIEVKNTQGTQMVGHGFLLGYDEASGKQLWSKPLDGRPSMYGTTLLNGVIYLSTIRTEQGQGNSVYAFSAKNGGLVWRYQDSDKSGSSYPTVTENGVYINHYSGQTLVALDPASGKIRWTYNFHDNLTVEYPPAADNDQVYLSLPGNMIQILRASDGRPIGSFKVNDTVDPNNRVLLEVVG